MNLVEIKTTKDFPLNGVDVEFVTMDKKVTEIHLKSGSVRFIIKRADSYSTDIKVFRADPYSVERKHVLKGTFCGIDVAERFEYLHEAENRLSALKDKDRDAELSISEQDVKVNDAGKILEDSDVPF